MTTLITRLYSDKATAEAVVAALHGIGLEADEVTLVTGSDAEAQMRGLRVGPATASSIGAGVARGHAAVVVAAPFNPRGIALRATRIVDAHHPVAGDDRYITEDYQPAGKSNLYPAGTYFMTIPPEHSGGPSHGHALSLGGLVSRDRTKTSAIRGGAHISTKFWPMPLLKQKSGGLRVKRDWQFSKMFGIPTVASIDLRGGF